MARSLRLELRLIVLETTVLPLHHDRIYWLGYRDSNSEPAGYEPDALTIELYPNVGSDDRTRTDDLVFIRHAI